MADKTELLLKLLVDRVATLTEQVSAMEYVLVVSGTNAQVACYDAMMRMFAALRQKELHG